MSDDAIHLAAIQIERHARHAEATGGAAGAEKAAGYRHALHVMRVMGGMPVPSPQRVAAELADHPILPGMALAAGS